MRRHGSEAKRERPSSEAKLAWHTVFSPCTGLCTHIRKKHRSDDEVQQQVHDDVQQRSQNYAFMLHNLMVMIQEYLLLNDDDKQRGALNSLDLVGSTAQLREDNRICIWLEDVWSER